MPRTSSSPTTLEITGIGRITFKRNRRARHLNLIVKPFSGIQVTSPPGIPLCQVKRFVVSKKGWIFKHLERAREMERKKRLASEKVAGMDSTQAAISLEQELMKLADRYGFRVGKITIRNQRTRWGSCSADNNISLNINLYHLPPKLQRYVLLHELLHTRIKNHGHHFWQEMDRLVDNARALRSELNEFSYLLAREAPPHRAPPSRSVAAAARRNRRRRT